MVQHIPRSEAPRSSRDFALCLAIAQRNKNPASGAGAGIYSKRANRTGYSCKLIILRMYRSRNYKRPIQIAFIMIYCSASRNAPENRYLARRRDLAPIILIAAYDDSRSIYIEKKERLFSCP